MYIVIEGPEATGKTTQAKLLADKLEKDGHSVLLTKEPGSPHDQVCVMIRNILLNPEHKISSASALFLFLADRAQHIEMVKKAIGEGKIVISDRSSLSSFVYHTAEKRGNVNEEEDLFLCKVLDMAQQISPNVCFLCSADSDWCIEKLKARNSLDRIEQFSEGFHRNTHSLFNDHNVMMACRMMQYGPKRVFATPQASNFTTTDISDFIFTKVKGLING